MSIQLCWDSSVRGCYNFSREGTSNGAFRRRPLSDRKTVASSAIEAQREKLRGSLGSERCVASNCNFHMTAQEFCLHNVSVVVTAKYHNPSVLNPGFLELNRIVPKEWDVDEAVTTPPLSIVTYKQGIVWNLDQTTLTVTENCDPDQSEFHVHRQVSEYVKTLPHVPYQGLGLNCVLSLATDNPAKWLTQRYLKPGPWRKGKYASLAMVPKFVFPVRNAICNLTMSPGLVHPEENMNQAAVVASSNLHHDGPFDAEALCATIDQWKEKHNGVLAALKTLFRGSQR